MQQKVVYLEFAVSEKGLPLGRMKLELEFRIEIFGFWNLDITTTSFSITEQNTPQLSNILKWLTKTPVLKLNRATTRTELRKNVTSVNIVVVQLHRTTWTNREWCIV